MSRDVCVWKAPQALLCAHSPQFVWVDVDPGWEAAAAGDKAQEAAPVLWEEEEKINACTGGEGRSTTSIPPQVVSQGNASSTLPSTDRW